MSLKSLVAIAGLTAALPLLGAALPSLAQTTQPGGPHASPARRPPTRIEVNPRPRPLLYRRCVDWYELQHRPSGTVLYPQMRCWWVRG